MKVDCPHCQHTVLVGDSNYLDDIEGVHTCPNCDEMFVISISITSTI